MSSKFYQFMKRWVSAHEPSKQDSFLTLQPINLEPYFDTQANQFQGVFFKSFVYYNDLDLHNLFEECLLNIAYWHCHHRAIRSILPLHAKTLVQPKLLNTIEELLIRSELPVGLISFAVQGTTTCSWTDLESALQRLHRLGVRLELYGISGSDKEFDYMSTELFESVHLSLSLMRAAHLDLQSRELLDQILNACEVNILHTYCGGISLVHDFIFAKNNCIDYCYGPLMMPAVSKHQILHIKESQFANMSLKPTPSFIKEDGDPDDH